MCINIVLKHDWCLECWHLSLNFILLLSDFHSIYWELISSVEFISKVLASAQGNRYSAKCFFLNIWNFSLVYLNFVLLCKFKIISHRKTYALIWIQKKIEWEHWEWKWTNQRHSDHCIFSILLFLVWTY